MESAVELPTDSKEGSPSSEDSEGTTVFLNNLFEEPPRQPGSPPLVIHREDGTICFPVKPVWGTIHYKGQRNPPRSYESKSAWDHNFWELLDPRGYLPTDGTLWPAGSGYHRFSQPWCICPFCHTRDLVPSTNADAVAELAVYLLPRCFAFAKSNTATWLDTHHELVLYICSIGWSTTIRILAIHPDGNEFWGKLSRTWPTTSAGQRIRDQLLGLFHTAKSHGMPSDYRFSRFLREVFHTIDYSDRGFGFGTDHIIYPSFVNLSMDADDFDWSLNQRLFHYKKPLRQPGAFANPFSEGSEPVRDASAMDQDERSYKLGAPTNWGTNIARAIPVAAFDSATNQTVPGPNLAGLIDVMQLRATSEAAIQDMERESLSRTVDRLRAYTEPLHINLSQLLDVQHHDDFWIDECGMALLAERHSREVADHMAGLDSVEQSSAPEPVPASSTSAKLRKLRKRRIREQRMDQQGATTDNSGSSAGIHGRQQAAANGASAASSATPGTRAPTSGAGMPGPLDSMMFPSFDFSQLQSQRPNMSPQAYQAMSMMMMMFMNLFPSTSAAFSNRPEHLTVFEHVGDMIPDISYLHVVVPVDINRFENMFAKAMTLMNEDSAKLLKITKFNNEEWYFPKTADRHDAFINPMWSTGAGIKMNVSLRHDMQEIHQSFQNIRASLPLASQSSPDITKQHLMGEEADGRIFATFNTTGAANRRQKRFWPQLIGALIGGGILGTFLGIFNHNQIQSMGNSKMIDLLVQDNIKKNQLIDTLDSRVTKALELSLVNLGDSLFINRYMVWASVVRHLQRRLSDFASLVDNLHKHRLSQQWFSSEQLKQLHQNVLEFAAQHQVIPLTEYPSDYCQIDASFVSASNQLVILLHVPATRKKEKWSIFRYHPFPIPNGNHTVTMISAPQSLIAMGADKRYKVLTESDLHHCLRRNHHYLCKSPVLTHTDFASTCVGALMGQLPDSIAALCRIHMEPEREMVMQASERTFAIFTPIPFTAHGACINGTIITKIITKSAIVGLEPGCSLNLRSHLIEVPFSLTTPRQPIVSTTNWDTLEVPKKLLREDDKRQMKMFQLLVNDTYDEAEFQDGLRLSQKQLAQLHAQLSEQVAANQNSTAIIIATIAAIVGFIAAVLLFCWCGRYWCNPFGIARPPPIPPRRPAAPVRMSDLPEHDPMIEREYNPVYPHLRQPESEF